MLVEQPGEVLDEERFLFAVDFVLLEIPDNTGSAFESRV